MLSFLVRRRGRNDQTWSSRDLSLGLETSWDPIYKVSVSVLNLHITHDNASNFAAQKQQIIVYHILNAQACVAANWQWMSLQPMLIDYLKFVTKLRCQIHILGLKWHIATCMTIETDCCQIVFSKVATSTPDECISVSVVCWWGQMFGR